MKIKITEHLLYRLESSNLLREVNKKSVEEFVNKFLDLCIDRALFEKDKDRYLFSKRLAPCPVCGSRVELLDDNNGMTYIFCSKCGNGWDTTKIKSSSEIVEYWKNLCEHLKSSF